MVCIDTYNSTFARQNAMRLSAAVMRSFGLSVQQMSQLKARLHFATDACSNLSTQVSDIIDGWMSLPLARKVGGALLARI